MQLDDFTDISGYSDMDIMRWAQDLKSWQVGQFWSLKLQLIDRIEKAVKIYGDNSPFERQPELAQLIANYYLFDHYLKTYGNTTAKADAAAAAIAK